MIAEGKIYRALQSYSVFSRVLKEFKENPELSQQSSELLLQIALALSGNQQLPINDPNSKLVQILCDNGVVLTNASCTHFVSTSPIINSYYSLLFSNFCSPLKDVALSVVDGSYDKVQLLLTVLQNFSPDELKKKAQYSFKQRESKTFSSAKNCIKESVFQERDYFRRSTSVLT